MSDNLYSFIHSFSWMEVTFTADWFSKRMPETLLSTANRMDHEVLSTCNRTIRCSLSTDPAAWPAEHKTTSLVRLTI